MFHATAIIVKRRNAITEFFAMPRPKGGKMPKGSKGGGHGKGKWCSTRKGGRKPRKRRVNPVDERTLGKKGNNAMPRKISEASKSEVSKSRPKWTQITVEAVCQEDGCGEVWDKANAMQMAAVHYDRTGHVVDVRQVTLVRFGSVAGPKDAPARVPQVLPSPDAVPPSPDWQEPMADEDLILGAPSDHRFDVAVAGTGDAVPVDAPEHLAMIDRALDQKDMDDFLARHAKDVAETREIRENLASQDPLPDLFPDEATSMPEIEEDRQSPENKALSVPAEAPPPFEF